MNKITLIQSAVNKYENRICGKFKPDNRFYTKVGINQKRFGQLLRGEKPLNVNEAKSLSEFFKVPVTELF